MNVHYAIIIHLRGIDFRMDYSRMFVLCSTLSSIPILATTGTATKEDRECIKKSLGLEACLEVIGNTERVNIKYNKHFRVGSDVHSLVGILSLMAEFLKK